RVGALALRPPAGPVVPALEGDLVAAVVDGGRGPRRRRARARRARLTGLTRAAGAARAPGARPELGPHLRRARPLALGPPARLPVLAAVGDLRTTEVHGGRLPRGSAALARRPGPRLARPGLGRPALADLHVDAA